MMFVYIMLRTEIFLSDRPSGTALVHDLDLLTRDVQHFEMFTDLRSPC